MLADYYFHSKQQHGGTHTHTHAGEDINTARKDINNHQKWAAEYIAEIMMMVCITTLKLSTPMFTKFVVVVGVVVVVVARCGDGNEL